MIHCQRWFWRQKPFFAQWSPARLSTQNVVCFPCDYYWLVNNSVELMSKQVWQAKDGELFDTEEECLRHERASLFLTDMNSREQYARNEERWGMQKNFSRHFLSGFQSIESFWNYSESFRTLGDVLDGKRPDLPKEIPNPNQAKKKLLPASKRKAK